MMMSLMSSMITPEMAELMEGKTSPFEVLVKVLKGKKTLRPNGKTMIGLTQDINLTFHLFATPDPEDPTKDAIAFLLRENK